MAPPTSLPFAGFVCQEIQIPQSLATSMHCSHTSCYSKKLMKPGFWTLLIHFAYLASWLWLLLHKCLNAQLICHHSSGSNLNVKLRQNRPLLVARNFFKLQVPVGRKSKKKKKKKIFVFSQYCNILIIWYADNLVAIFPSPGMTWDWGEAGAGVASSWLRCAWQETPLSFQQVVQICCSANCTKFFR